MLGIVIVGFVGYLSVTGRDVRSRDVADLARADLPHCDPIGDSSD